MYKKFLLLVATPLLLSAGGLDFVSGEVNDHTEVFGDSTINPSTKTITVNASMGEEIETLQGSFSIKTLDLISDNSDRDEHMYEALFASSQPNIVFTITQVTKNNDAYDIDGVLSLNGQSKPIHSLATISKENNNIALKGSFAINMSDHGVKPPKLLFLTVRNRVDITYEFILKK